MTDKFKKRPTPPPPLPRAWRRAIQRLDQALEQNAPLDNREKIEMLGRQMFGDLWEPRKLPSKTND
jgi:hypothetical protein